MNFALLPFMSVSSGFAETLAARLAAASIELAVLTGAVALASVYLRPKFPRFVALLWSLVLLKPLLTLAAGGLLTLQIPIYMPAEDAGVSPPVANAIYRTEIETSNPDLDLKMETALPAIDSATSSRNAPLVFALSLWAAGSLLFAARFARGWLSVRGQIAKSEEAAEPLRTLSSHLARECKLRRAPDVRVSGSIDSPAIAGFIRPVILIPEWMLNLSEEETLTWSLRHELTHARHLDPAANFMRRITEIVFFFHPCAWLAGRQWESAAELACDRALVSDLSEARDYAAQLYSMLERARLPGWERTAGALGATRTQIGRRIETLLRSTTYTSAMPKPVRWMATLAAIAVAASGVTLSPIDAEGEQTDSRGLHTRRLNIEEIRRGESGSRVELDVKGHLEFRGEDVWEITRIRRRSSLELREKGELIDRAVRVTSGDAQKPVYRYTENGKSREFDDESAKWLGAWLAKILGDKEEGKEEEFRTQSESNGRRAKLNAETETISPLRTDRLHARGVFEFSADGRELLWLDQDAVLKIERILGPRNQSITITPDANGKPSVDFRVNGQERSLDSSAKVWLKNTILGLSPESRRGRN